MFAYWVPSISLGTLDGTSKGRCQWKLFTGDFLMKLLVEREQLVLGDWSVAPGCHRCAGGIAARHG